VAAAAEHRSTLQLQMSLWMASGGRRCGLLYDAAAAELDLDVGRPPPSTAALADGSPNVWSVGGGRRRELFDDAAAAALVSIVWLPPIVSVAQAVAGWRPPPNISALADGSPSVWLVGGGRRRELFDNAAAAALVSTVWRPPIGAVAHAVVGWWPPPSTAALVDGSPSVWLVGGGRRRELFDDEAAAALVSMVWRPPTGAVAHAAVGWRTPPNTSALADGSPSVWLVGGGRRRELFDDAAAAARVSIVWRPPIGAVAHAVAGWLPPPISSALADGGPSVWLVGGGRRRELFEDAAAAALFSFVWRLPIGAGAHAVVEWWPPSSTNAFHNHK